MANGPLGSPFQSGVSTPAASGQQSGQVNGQNQPNDVGQYITGSAQSPGLMGNGMYVAPSYNINSAAFQNPAGNQGQNWNNAMAGFLGQTTGAAPQLGAAAQSAGPNLGQYNSTTGQLQSLAGQYAQQAAGNGPSLAAVTAGQQANQNYATQLSQLGASGGNPALAKYAAGNALGATQQGAAQNATLGRTTEEMNALNQQGSIYTGLNNNAINTAQLGQANNQFNTGQTNSFALNQGQLQAGQNALNANQYNQYVSNLGSVNQQQLQANVSQQQLGVQQQLGLDQIQQQAYANAAQRNGSIFSGIANSASSLLGMAAPVAAAAA